MRILSCKHVGEVKSWHRFKLCTGFWGLIEGTANSILQYPWLNSQILGPLALMHRILAPIRTWIEHLQASHAGSRACVAVSWFTASCITDALLKQGKHRERYMGADTMACMWIWWEHHEGRVIDLWDNKNMVGHVWTWGFTTHVWLFSQGIS